MSNQNNPPTQDDVDGLRFDVRTLGEDIARLTDEVRTLRIEIEKLRNEGVELHGP
ncbi:MAG: hypothetical protein OXI71_01915 [Gemmatimonadota bacterium]|nr:hypothetical protein [Gemmatimonadota bacterium]